MSMGNDKPLADSPEGFLEDEKVGTFVLDLRGYDENATEQPEGGDTGANTASGSVDPEQRLEELLAPYGAESVNKARGLLRGTEMVKLVKTDGQIRTYNVAGSKLYVVRLTVGDDFLYAECSCPNGMHRGGEANCYHSIAARVLDSGLRDQWLDVIPEAG